MSSTLVALHLPLTHRPQLHTFPKLYPLRIIPKFPPPFTIRKSHISFSINNNNSTNNYDDREESRWLREEQRWLREEQRWLRYEQSLLNQIADLKLQIQALEGRNSLQGVPDSVTLLQLLKKEGDLGKKLNQIAESGSTAVPFEVEAAPAAEVEEEVVVKEVIGVSENETKQKVSLKKGAEGDDVRAMQEALEKLGFYSGEEDMEFASFSSGTERAIKTWQATIGTPENGIMTSDLLEMLYLQVKTGDSNGSVLEPPEIQQRVVKDETEYSHNRVFLLGENRWEDSSRLTSNKNKQVGLGMNSTKCVPCRGEGRLLCLECDGTGEPNIEEQFLEWVEEGMKCPYCEGLGYTICDACEGKALISA